MITITIVYFFGFVISLALIGRIPDTDQRLSFTDALIFSLMWPVLISILVTAAGFAVALAPLKFIYSLSKRKSL